MFLLRLRDASSGETRRIQINESSSIAELKENLRVNVGVSASSRIMLSREQTPFKELSFASSISKCNIKHGDIIFYKIDHTEAQQSSQSMQEEHSLGESATHNCTHPPMMKCMHCDPDWNSASLQSALADDKCIHGPGITCTKCANLGERAGGRLRWLCRHSPDARCANCMNLKGEAVDKCTHPSSTVCPKCIGKIDSARAGSSSASFSTGKGVIDKERDKKVQCLHGPNAMCANCLPKTDEEEEEKYVCRRHGPNASCWACLEYEESKKIRISAQQERHCSGVKVDFDSANVFQSYITRPGAPINRRGVLYGKIEEETQTVVVHAIYEPPQEVFDGLTVINEDGDSLKRAEMVAKCLGLQEVGWIISHEPYLDGIDGADPPPLSAWDVNEAARLQASQGNTFVTISLTVTVNEDGRRFSDFQAFQVSDQCMRLHKANRLGFTPGVLDKCQISGLPVKVEGDDSSVVDVHLFTVLVPIAEYKSFLSCDFPIENRLDEPQGNDDLKSHMSRDPTKPYNDRLRDYHLLLYISTYFETPDMESICSCVAEGQDSEIPSGYAMVIEALYNSSF